MSCLPLARTNSGAEFSPLAEIEPGAVLGAGSRVWRWVLIRSSVRLGRNCVIGSHAVIGPDVEIGDGCRIQDRASLYGPLRIGEGVFIGPGAIVCNDRVPRVGSDWHPGRDGVTRIEGGASVGAGAVILPGVRIGAGAMVGAGALVLRDVPAGETWAGNPARRIG